MFFGSKKEQQFKNQIRSLILKNSSPRLQMLFILLITTFFGLFCSFLLYHSGLKEMWIRYSLTILFAYFIFFCSVQIWIKIILYQNKVSINEISEKIEATADNINNITDSIGNIAENTEAGFSFDLDLDEGFAWIFVIAIIALLIIIFCYFIVVAPVFISELILQSVAVTGLYKKVKHMQQENWVGGFFKKTWIPFMILLIFFMGTGFLLQKIYPEANTIKDILQFLF